MTIPQQLKQLLGDALIENEPLSKYTTIKIGGPAKYFVHGKSSEILKKAYAAAVELAIPYFLLAGGSNLLVSDKGIEGLVIRVENDDLKIEGEKVFCGAGLSLAKLTSETVRSGLAGCEWAIVIPGYVGGSIRGNAGAYGGDFSQITAQVQVFDGKEEKTYSRDQIQFHYRDSIFKHQQRPEIILSAQLDLKKDKPAECRQRMLSFLKKKNTEHPMGLPSCGCFFKNVELLAGSYELKDPALGRPSDFFKSEVPAEFIDRGSVPAGFLIEALDLKGKKIGGIQVSPKHANYLVNTNDAKAADVIMMLSLIKQKARTAFGVQLKEEVQLVGF